MKIIEEELIEELESWRDYAIEMIKDAHKMKISQNCYGVGYSCGERDTCQRILHYIKHGWEGENYEVI